MRLVECWNGLLQMRNNVCGFISQKSIRLCLFYHDFAEIGRIWLFCVKLCGSIVKHEVGTVEKNMGFVAKLTQIYCIQSCGWEIMGRLDIHGVT